MKDKLETDEFQQKKQKSRECMKKYASQDEVLKELQLREYSNEEDNFNSLNSLIVARELAKYT